MVYAWQDRDSSYRILGTSINNREVDPDSILSWFIRADAFMEIDRYDSAEYWLGRVGDRLSLKKPGAFNYYYHTRQAEVFYYNDLLQLGMQQTSRALQIALQLNDSLFLADAYNFLGLFSLNLEKLQEAEQYLLKGLSFFSPTGTRTPLLALSRPYHLHGNIGEVYTKQKKYDKALYHFKRSIEAAQWENQRRPHSLALISSGEVLFELQQHDSALVTLTQGVQKAMAEKDYDVALFGYGMLAFLYADMGLFEEAKNMIRKGTILKQQNPQLNPFYTLLYMKRAVSALKLMNDYKAVSAIQEEILNTEQTVSRKSNIMTEIIFDTGVKNENRLLQIELNERKRQQKEDNIRTAGLLVIMVLMVIAGLYYRNSVRQKLKLASIREKISQDLHDNIGASISSLHIYSSLAQDILQKQPDKTGELLERITAQSRNLMENMNDMVWSMKSDGDVMPLGSRIKNFGAELLTVKNIQCTYEIDEEAFKLFKAFDDRKNILLLIKEAMNNMAKYSHATNALVRLRRETPWSVSLVIEDNGTGFDPEGLKKGNGLKHMESRVREMKGTLSFESASGKGLRISASIPVP